MVRSQGAGLGDKTLYTLESMKAASDPRNPRFYALKKKGIGQLNREELRELLGISERMLLFVGEAKGRRSWSDFIAQIQHEMKREK
jgi:hypothetical protein